MMHCYEYLFFSGSRMLKYWESSTPEEIKSDLEKNFSRSAFKRCSPKAWSGLH